MTRGLRWMLAIGLGGALVAGCQNDETRQAGRFNDPIHQKYQSPASGASDTGQGGSGDQGIRMDRGWQQHPSNTDTSSRDTRGPYTLDRAQPLPRERQSAPLGVGAGSDTARKMAQDQLKSE